MKNKIKIGVFVLLLAVIAGGYIIASRWILTAKEAKVINTYLSGTNAELAKRPVNADFKPLTADELIAGMQPHFMESISSASISEMDAISEVLKMAMAAKPDSIVGRAANLPVVIGGITKSITFCVINGNKVVTF